MRSPAFLALLVSTALAFSAEDGAQVYNSLCVACHGPDGKGLNGLPPLVGSEWIRGQADRSIKIVLQGMTGPVEVAGKSYNIEMPPHGAVLSDEKIAAALTYVRKTFGEGAGAVTPALVKSIRAATANRTAFWSAAELLKAHPFPPQRTALINLVGTMYKGQWKEMPNFATLKPAQIEDENSGVISPKQAGLKDDFAMVWEAKFEAPQDGKYTFVFDCDDFGALYVNGERIAEIKGIGAIGGRRKEASVLLKKGLVPFRLEYVQGGGEYVIVLGYKGPNDKDYKWLSDAPGTVAKAAKARLSIPIAAQNGYTASYRNFIAGTTPRGIGFGFPNGLNIVYSGDNLGAELIWNGKFMDAARHWTNRGEGNEPPAGENVLKLTGVAAVSSAVAASGEHVIYQGGKAPFRKIPVVAEFKGYELDKSGNPTFKVVGEGFAFTDAWVPAEDHGKASLTRTIKASGNTPVTILLAVGLPNVANDGLIELSSHWSLKTLSGVEPTAAGKELKLTLKPGESAVLGYILR